MAQSPCSWKAGAYSHRERQCSQGSLSPGTAIHCSNTTEAAGPCREHHIESNGKRKPKYGCWEEKQGEPRAAARASGFWASG